MLVDPRVERRHGLGLPLVVLQPRLPAVQRDGRHARLHRARDVPLGGVADLPLFIIIIHDPILMLRQVRLLVHARDRLPYQFVVLVHDDARELALLVRRVQAVGVVDRLVALYGFGPLWGRGSSSTWGQGFLLQVQRKSREGRAVVMIWLPGEALRVLCVALLAVSRQLALPLAAAMRNALRVCWPESCRPCACLWAARE